MRSAINLLAKIFLVIIALPLAAIAAVVSRLTGAKEKLSAADVALCLRNFIDGNGGSYDWDEFTSVPIENPHLEDIRRRAAEVDIPVTSEGLITLRGLLDEVERLLDSEV